MRTSNPIELVFDPVRLRTRATRRMRMRARGYTQVELFQLNVQYDGTGTVVTSERRDRVSHQHGDAPRIEAPEHPLTRRAFLRRAGLAAGLTSNVINTGATSMDSGTTTFYVSPNGNDANNGTSWARAKKTLLAAYDLLPDGGGTIYFIDGTQIGGTVANQGLWILGPNDSRFNSPPAGWRKQRNAVRIIGIPASSYPPNPMIGSAQLIAGALTDTTKPAIWISGNGSTIRFENVAIYNTAAVAMKLGIDSATGADTNTSTISFFGCFFQPNQVAGAGPTIQVGWAYWVWFDKCGIAGNGNGSTADAKAALLIKPQTNSSYLFFLKDVQLNGGGVRFYSAGATSWDFSARNITLEEIPTNGAGIEFVSVNNLGQAIIEYVDMHDSGVGAIPVRISSAIDPAAVIVTHATASGPRTQIGAYPPGWAATAPNGFTVGGSSIVLPVTRTDPTVLFNGMMWYNSTSGTFKCYQHGAVKTFTVS